LRCPCDALDRNDSIAGFALAKILQAEIGDNSLSAKEPEAFAAAPGLVDAKVLVIPLHAIAFTRHCGP